LRSKAENKTAALKKKPPRQLYATLLVSTDSSNRLRANQCQLLDSIGQTPDFPATHAAVATVAPFPAWRDSQGLRCAEPGI